MNKTLVGAVLIAVLIGIVGGYALGYVIYQPQLQSLQNEMDNLHDEMHGEFQLRDDHVSILNTDLYAINSSLQSQITAIETRRWHEVYSVSGFSNITHSGTFQLKGKEVRVMWTAISSVHALANGWVSFILHYSDGTPFGIWASSGHITANNAVLELDEIGLYYLEINTYETDYHVSVWDSY